MGAGEGLAGRPYSAVWNGTSWRALDTLAANGARSLSSVSCASRSSCVAVGGNVVQDPIAEVWNGRHWRLVTPPDQFLPLGISCPAASFCVAAGHTIGSAQGSARQAVTMTWDGSAWHAATLPAVPGAVSSSLSSVSCVSASLCTAVGYYTAAKRGPALTLAEQWNGSGWQLQSIPDVPVQPSSNSAFGDFLTSISCTSTGNCVAVGETETFDADAGVLAESWDGSTWTLLPDVNAGGNSRLTGISCVASDCVAVGGSGLGPLAYSWDGSSWQGLSNPEALQLGAVSCVSPTACVTVGSDFPGQAQPPQVALSGLWNGSSWQVRLVGVFAGLTGVSCDSAVGCMAVGMNLDAHGDERTLAEQRTGGAWRQRSSPMPGAEVLIGVSCTGPVFCLAVSAGSSMTWNGSRWRVRSLPAGSLARNVSCTSPDNCMITGVESSARWDGHAWHQLAIHLPLGELNDVSCRSKDWCMAVGITSDSLPVADLWNGRTWRPTSLPQARSVDDLTGISCSSRFQCLAVGTDDTGRGRQHATADLWNGKTWRLLTAPGRGLGDVSCPGASRCLAVGHFTRDGVTSSDAALWNGRRWQQTSLSGVLSSVSCLGAADCTAVGQTTTGIALAEQWNGASWKRLAPVNP